MMSKTKWFWGMTCIFAIGVVILFFSLHKAILQKAGRFMIPETNQMTEVADAVIIEGTRFISRSMLDRGVYLLTSGKAKKMIIVVQQTMLDDRHLGVDEYNFTSVKTELKKIGLNDSDFTIIEIPERHPITLTSARSALEILSRDGGQTAFLLSPGFHLQRSFLVYQHLSMPLNIKIHPVACFDDYNLDNWWNEGTGVHEFMHELTKLMYYMATGYIPLKLSY